MKYFEKDEMFLKQFVGNVLDENEEEMEIESFYVNLNYEPLIEFRDGTKVLVKWNWLLNKALEYKLEEDKKRIGDIAMKSLSIDKIVEFVKGWSIEKGLDKSDSNKQFIKLAEEFGEMAQGIAKNNKEQVIDSIGDMLVVLTIYCQQEGLELKDCFAAAWNEIKDRQGKMVNGVFIKSEDL